jgi:hypothetical protein
MVRKLRIAAFCTLGVGICLLLAFGGTYYAAQQVRPFYAQALQLEPDVLERGSRELESRATALYSEARQAGEWHAVFTAEQINGWLALQLTANRDIELSSKIGDPRVAIAPDVLTLGFRASSGGVDTVVSVDASVFLTEEGAVAIRLISVRAGALPLPVMQLADEIATACKELSLPVRWTRQDGKPVAVVDIQSDSSTDDRRFKIDAIELGEGELYVAGHTEIGQASAATEALSSKINERFNSDCREVALDEFELRLTPRDRRSALKVARRAKGFRDKDSRATDR